MFKSSLPPTAQMASVVIAENGEVRVGNIADIQKPVSNAEQANLQFDGTNSSKQTLAIGLQRYRKDKEVIWRQGIEP